MIHRPKKRDQSAQIKHDQSPVDSRLTILVIYLLVTILVVTSIYSFGQLNTPLQTLFFSALSVVLAAILANTIKTRLPFLKKFSSYKKPKQTLRILVVDDNKANRKILCEFLGHQSCTISEAKDGKSALKLYQDHLQENRPFQLIFMDIEMEGMSGLQVVSAIREQEQGERIPIIAVSAHHRTEKQIEALSSGFDDYLTKPINLDTLNDTIDRWLSPKAIATFTQRKHQNPNLSSIQKTSATPEFSARERTSVKEVQSTPVDNQNKDTSSQPEQSVQKIVDIQQSLTYSHNNPELAKEMLSMLITLVRNERENILTLFEQQQWLELGQLVHKINGGSCYCGVPYLQQQAQLLDGAIDKEDYRLAQQTFPQFIKALNHLLDWQEEYDLDVIFE